MLTYIMQSSLSLPASHKPTCALTHTHTVHICCYTITVQQGGNRCPFRLRGRRAHSHCVCVQWGGLGTNTFLQSQSRQCPSVRKCRNSAFRLPVQRQLMQKYDDMKSEISVRAGPEDKFRKKQKFFFGQHSCPQ